MSAERNADAKRQAVTGFSAEADANCTWADAKTLANTRRTQNRGFPTSPYMHHMFTPLHTSSFFYRRLFTPICVRLKKR
jgi:hypothetical protein